jgi:S-(hydroxymethyl)glutathione dehydrogenase/alcohol dehydrogenase
VAGCRLQRAERIVCVDLSDERLALATGQGATDTMVGGADTLERILEMTGGFGADYTFEATGSVAVMRQAVEAARMGWGLCTVAGVAGKGETLDVVPRLLITGRRIAGSSFGASRAASRSRSSSSDTLRATSTSTPSSPIASRSTRSTAASS